MIGKVSALVTARWLHNAILNGSPKNLRVLDSSWHMPETKRSGKNEYDEKHIPGASFFDIDECCDKMSPYSHMLPDIKHFEQYAGNLGIDAGTHVVVYDNSPNFGFFSAPRVWWMFRVFGHNSVSVLDGGFTKWQSDGLPTTSDVSQPAKTIFHGLYQPQMVKSFDDMVANLSEKSFQVVDARGEGRFMGTLPEPREGIESGHIKGSKNIPYKCIVNQDKGALLDDESLKRMFSQTIDLSGNVVASCGSGVSACCLAFAAFQCGKEIPVYDGSWTEFYLRSTKDMRFCPGDNKDNKS